MKIKNVIFDIGNVLLRYEPEIVVRSVLPEYESPQELTAQIFKSQIWYDLNLGKLTEKEVIQIYNKQCGISEGKLEKLMNELKESLVPIKGSFELLDELYSLGMSLYSITDNVKEIINFLRSRYNFFNKFSGITVSADIGVLKPSPLIYMHLIESNSLIPNESVFIDDLLINVQGARNAGIKGIHFINSAECRLELQQLGIPLK